MHHANFQDLIPYIIEVNMNKLHRSMVEAGRAAVLLLAAALLSSCATVPTVPPGARSDLAPTGKLRAAINFGNPILAARDSSTGEPRGVSVDLSRELARRLGVPVQFVTYDAAGKVVEGLKSGAWDVAYVAIDPARAVDISYTAPYVVIEGAYLVPQGSPIRSNADVDREGVRVAVGAGSAYDLFLSRNLKHAKIVRAPTSPAVTDMFVAQKLEVAAGVKQQLEADARRHSRIAPAGRSVHGDQSGDGNAQGPRSRREIPPRVCRGNEGIRIRRPGARAAPR